MAHDINKTPVVPYIIAERAIWNVLEEKYKELSSEQCCKVVEIISPLLVHKAETIYSTNSHFRKQMNSHKTDPRYYLEMFMEHWTYGLLNKGKVQRLAELNTQPTINAHE
jgi:hypothetical protein